MHTCQNFLHNFPSPKASTSTKNKKQKSKEKKFRLLDSTPWLSLWSSFHKAQHKLSPSPIWSEIDVELALHDSN